MKFLSTLSLLWEKWNIRTFLIASFTFQLLLIIAAPFRKRTSHWIICASLWASYLLADWVAVQAIGLIIRATEPGSQSVSDAQIYLFSFWAQFLLIHLGGPDTITALALEDTVLWPRMALHLGTQVYATLGVLFRSTRSGGLLAATVLMFFAGTIKYLERVMSLFHGRLMDLDENPRDFADKLGKHRSALANGNVEDQSKGDDPLSNVEMVRDAFNLFHCHKRLFVDRKLPNKVRRSTRDYFMKRTAEEAYKLLEIELNFTYEAIYTKMAVFQKPEWKILRLIVLSLEVVGLVIWCLADKKDYPDYDIQITYALVVGTIAVDVLAFLRIQLSDWNIALLDLKEGRGTSRIRMELYSKLLAARTRNGKEPVLVQPTYSSSSILLLMRQWFRRVFLRRWSESIPQFDLNEGGLSMAAYFKLERLIARETMGKKGLSSEMWDLIFELVKKHKSPQAWPWSGSEIASKVMEEPLDIKPFVDKYFSLLSEATKPFKDKVAKPFMEKVVNPIWHMLTSQSQSQSHPQPQPQPQSQSQPQSHGFCNRVIELWEKWVDEEGHTAIKMVKDVYLDILVDQVLLPTYSMEKNYTHVLMSWVKLTEKLYDEEKQERASEVGQDISLRQDISITLMRYLQYLMFIHPDMMFGAAGKAEILALLDHNIKPSSLLHSDDDDDDKEDGSKSVVNIPDPYDNIRNIVYKSKQWELIARVWVKILCYTAIKCRPDVLAKKLKEGGELLSFVWLLMVNLDITKVQIQ